MADLLFYLFAAITLISALAMVLLPNAVNGAMCMIVSFLGTAALFVLLDAYFLAILQVLVYAGAVMVLFLFIIMLLNVDEEAPRAKPAKLSIFAALSGFTILSVLVVSLFNNPSALPEPPVIEVAENPLGPSAANGIPFTTSAKSFGYSLFTKYMLPFQVTGFLLLAAMVGVIVVSKRMTETTVKTEQSD
ncbi:MAG: NADH-quinone oxidoreductase subunit J [Opitutia bacterium UBA7350]|nr:MAG: NADH-quinone oxidoreductase subunit J [Opitutae bacterium UBA7350]